MILKIHDALTWVNNHFNCKHHMVQVVFAVNGKEALSVHDSQTFQIIFMDVNMPIMNGFEVVLKIRQNSTTSSNLCHIYIQE